MNFLKRFFPGNAGDGEKKKLNQGLIVLLVVGVMLMLFNSLFFREQASEGEERGRAAPEIAVIYDEGEEEAAGAWIAELLNGVAGVSDARVYFTYESGPQFEYVHNFESNRRETLEQDREGGTREIVDLNERTTYVILRNSQGDEQPLLMREIKPEIQGVLVVARGVENSKVKARVTEAVKTLLGVSSHRISVLPAD